MKTFTNLSVFAITFFLVMACGEIKERKNARELGNIESVSSVEIGDHQKDDAEDTATLSAMVQQNERFDSLDLALMKADLHSTLNEDVTYTIFAPTDEAFSNLPEGYMDRLLIRGKEPELLKLLTYHIVAGKHSLEELKKGISDNEGAYPLETLEGGRITFSLQDGRILLTDVTGNMAHIAKPDIGATNGLAHAINQVLAYK